MGFRWRDSVKGGINGFRAGSRFGPYGMIAGTIGGAAAGGYGKDIDKKLTGNSQSGFTSGLIESAGNMGSTGSGGSAAGIGGNLFDRFSGGDKVEEGYENNPAVLAREKESDSGGGSGMFDIGGIMGGGGGNGGGGGGFDLMSMFGGSGSSGGSGGKNSNGGLDVGTLMNLFSRNSSSNSGGGGMGYASMLSNLFSRN